MVAFNRVTHPVKGELVGEVAQEMLGGRERDCREGFTLVLEMTCNMNFL